MKFIVINSKLRTVETVDVPDLRDAIKIAELGHVDHGMLSRGLAYVVYEFGHFVPPGAQHYCSIGRTLISGNAVLYGVDEAGDTIDTVEPETIDVRFYRDSWAVEAAIERGAIIRPERSINGKREWSWPEPMVIPR